MSINLLPSTVSSRSSRTGWVGIDIGTSAVKIAVISKSKNKFALEHQELIPVESVNGHVEIACNAARYYTSWLGKVAGKSAAISCSLNLDLRSLEVPPSERDNIQLYLENQPGLSGSGVRTAVWPTTWRMPPNEMLPCHVFGFHQETADDIASSLHQSGLRPEAMESIPHVLARLPKLINWQTNEVHAVIDWAADNPLFVLSRYGLPYYTRRIKRCSYSDLVKEVSDKLKLDTNDVWQLLTELGRASINNQRFSKILSTLRDVSQTTRQALLSEISKTIGFLKNEDKELIPKKIWVVGAGAGYPNVSTLIEESTEIPTEIWSLPSDNTETIDSANYASAISLSARPFFQ